MEAHLLSAEHHFLTLHLLRNDMMESNSSKSSQNPIDFAKSAWRV